MALSDYALCNVCGKKVFYDACFTDERYLKAYRSDRMALICEDCTKDYEVKIQRRENDDE